MKISVLLPTRKRAKRLVNTIKSLVDNVSHDNYVEILLRFDEDDLDTVIYVKEFVKQEICCDNNTVIKYFIGPRYGYIRMDRYFNELASKAEGDWFVIIGSDTPMETKDWDKKVEKYGEQIVIFRSFAPAIPRKIFGILGHIGMSQIIDAWSWFVMDGLNKVGYQISVPPPFKVGHDNVQDYDRDVDFENKEYIPGFFNLEFELARVRDVKLIKKYLDEIKYTGDEFIKSFEKKKSTMALYHHDDQINLQKNEYELLKKMKAEVIAYPLFRLMCHTVPFRNSVPHVFMLMKLARYSKIGILELGTGQGESATALGIGAKMYNVRDNGSRCEKLTTVDIIQPKNQANGYFELFKEFMPADRRIIESDPKRFSFSEPIDLLFINGNGTYEDAYTNCGKYVPLVVRDGIIIFNDTGNANVVSAIMKFLDENKDNIKYELLPMDTINYHEKFLYNNIGICAMRIL